MKLILSRDFPQSPPKGSCFLRFPKFLVINLVLEVKPSDIFLWFAGFFLTKIFHPNIATSGEICVNTLKKDWNPGLGLRHVLLVSLEFSIHQPLAQYFVSCITKSLSKQFKLPRTAGIISYYWHNMVETYWVTCWCAWQVVRCLLIEPFPESALNEQAGKMLLENYEEYARHARSALYLYITNFK